MAKQLHRSVRLLTGTSTGLLLALACSSAFASSGFSLECDEVNDAVPVVEIAASSLAIKSVEHGLADSAADMKDPASDPAIEKLTSPALAEVSDVSLTDSNDKSSTEQDDADAVKELPETALRLPGVAEEDQPRFRRQMYRTDI